MRMRMQQMLRYGVYPNLAVTRPISDFPKTRGLQRDAGELRMFLESSGPRLSQLIKVT
jgi:hypothetical protein